MHRIDAPDATSDHRFTSGDPTIPVPATTVTADWLNSVQEELAAAIAAAGISLDKTKNDQLKTALGILIEAGVGTVTPEAIGAVPVTRTVTAGAGLTGGGALNANRTLAVKLVNAVNSTDATSAATANAVKIAYDTAVAAANTASSAQTLAGAKAPMPQGGAGVGRWVYVADNDGTGDSTILPAGGTWTYYLLGINATGGVTATPCGVAAGGSVIHAGDPQTLHVAGLGWRIA